MAERLEQWLSDEENFETVGLLALADFIDDLAGVFVLWSVWDKKVGILEHFLDSNEGENIRLKTRLPQPDRIPFGCMAADRNEFFETDYGECNYDEYIGRSHHLCNDHAPGQGA